MFWGGGGGGAKLCWHLEATEHIINLLWAQVKAKLGEPGSQSVATAVLAHHDAGRGHGAALKGELMGQVGQQGKQQLKPPQQQQQQPAQRWS